MLLATTRTQATQKALSALAWSCVFNGRMDQLIELYPASGSKRTHNPEAGT
jgi:hypothetical protein